MSDDYKYLADPSAPGKQPKRRNVKHHVAIGAGIIAVLATLLSITPDDASATRDLKTQAPVARAYDPSSAVTNALPLPTGEQTAPVAAAPAPGAQQGDWHEVKVKRGDNLAVIFNRLGIPPRELQQVLQLGEPVKDLKNLYPGEMVRVRINDQHELLGLSHDTDPTHSLRVRRVGDSYQAQEIHRQVELRQAYAAGTIEDSLFQSAQRAGLSDNLTMELAAIFGWDIDFALDIREGDHFAVVYEDKYLNGNRIGTGDIVAAEFTNHGTTYRAIRYTDASGHTDYYSPDGHSLRRAFLRTPVKFTRISSRFSLHRMHPILNRIRAHKGVDYAAPTGTPIRAAGDGKIIFRGRKGGYGRVIIIRHGSHYSTLYGHMSAFNRKVHLGSHVRQGQVIGYVGMSGLATGPHLHYEFRVNGVHRNPLTVKLPQAKPIEARYRSDFLRHATPLVAQLELVKRTLLARK